MRFPRDAADIGSAWHGTLRCEAQCQASAEQSTGKPEPRGVKHGFSPVKWDRPECNAFKDHRNGYARNRGKQRKSDL